MWRRRIFWVSLINNKLKFSAAFAILKQINILGLIKLVVLLKKRLLIIDTMERLQSGILVPNVQRGGKIEEILIKECISMTYKQVSSQTYDSIKFISTYNDVLSYLKSSFRWLVTMHHL